MPLFMFYSFLLKSAVARTKVIINDTQKKISPPGQCCACHRKDVIRTIIVIPR